MSTSKTPVLKQSPNRRSRQTRKRDKAETHTHSRTNCIKSFCDAGDSSGHETLKGARRNAVEDGENVNACNVVDCHPCVCDYGDAKSCWGDGVQRADSIGEDGD